LATAILILLVNWVNTNGENCCSAPSRKRCKRKRRRREWLPEPQRKHHPRLDDEVLRRPVFLGEPPRALAASVCGFARASLRRFAVLLMSLPAVSFVSYALMALHHGSA